MHPPSVDAVARRLAAEIDLPLPLLVDAARAAVASGDPATVDARAADAARDLERMLLRRVVNATGVLLHTNLGRTPLGVEVEEGYSNLEIDLTTGRRGSRQTRVGSLAARACGSESAMVVNNGAGAVLLVLAALAAGRGVAVSRGELVEIGTTNRTRVADFAAVVGADLAAVLRVHRSNYRIVGFTEEPSVADLAAIGPPLVVDLGSGLLDARAPWLDGPPPEWLAHEPAVRQTLHDGAALVTFSGDKLLGGPQAGIIAGRADLVDRCGAHPLARALRPGSLVLAALQQVLLAYLRDDGQAIPFWRMASLRPEDLAERATKVGSRSTEWEPAPCWSVPGGGSLPGLEIPSFGLSAPGDHTGALRAAAPPVIARVHDDRTIVDLRTVDPADDDHLAEALAIAHG